MIISKRKYNEAMERERAAVYKEMDTDRRFSEMWNRMNELDKRVCHLERITHADQFEPTLVLQHDAVSRR